MRLMNGAAFVVLAAGSLMMVEASSVSAQTNGAEAIKMLDTDNDGTVDLAECKTAGAATFEKLDADKSTTLDQEELGDRAVVGLVQAPINRMFFQTRPSKDDYVVLIVRRFELADPDHDGKLDAEEFQTEDGKRLLKLLH
jgi:Ca2+-binding EF-hand superfamily protein